MRTTCADALQLMATRGDRDRRRQHQDTDRAGEWRGRKVHADVDGQGQHSRRPTAYTSSARGTSTSSWTRPPTAYPSTRPTDIAPMSTGPPQISYSGKPGHTSHGCLNVSPSNAQVLRPCQARRHRRGGQYAPGDRRARRLNIRGLPVTPRRSAPRGTPDNQQRLIHALQRPHGSLCTTMTSDTPQTNQKDHDDTAFLRDWENH